jgi:hypothetical protein
LFLLLLLLHQVSQAGECQAVAACQGGLAGLGKLLLLLLL